MDIQVKNTAPTGPVLEHPNLAGNQNPPQGPYSYGSAPGTQKAVLAISVPAHSRNPVRQPLHASNRARDTTDTVAQGRTATQRYGGLDPVFPGAPLVLRATPPLPTAPWLAGNVTDAVA